MPGRIGIGSRVMSCPARSLADIVDFPKFLDRARARDLGDIERDGAVGKPRASLISVCSARETTSREASSSLFGAYFSMKRSPSALKQPAPSPRALSDQQAIACQRGRVVLDHLHVHQPRAGR